MIVDGNSIINRAFYAVPILTNSEGIYTNAVYGFLNIVFKLIEEESPQYIAVTFDLPAPTFRHQKYADYKGNRKTMPEELKQQIPILKDLLDAMGIYRVEKESYEGDDLIGTLSKKAQQLNIIPVIVSGDRDLLQLATDTVKIRIPKTKGGKTEIEDYLDSDVISKYGVTPREFIDLKALMGDSSDNVPGVPAIGEKTASKIIHEYHCIESAIENADNIKPKRISENLKQFKDTAILSKELVTICTDVPIEIDFENMKLENIFNSRVYDIFKKLNFKTFLSRFEMKKQPTQLTFSDTINTEIKSSKIQTNRISGIENIEDYISKLMDMKMVSYIIFVYKNNFAGISFCYDNDSAQMIEIDENVTSELLISYLKPFFESDSIEKIAHNEKENISLLKKYKIELKNVIFDVSIAGYILNPTRETYYYDDLAEEFLNESYQSEEEIFGKGKSKIGFFDISEAERQNYACQYANIVYRTKSIMEKKLNLNGQTELYYSIEHPLIRVLASMERYGIKVDQNKLIDYGESIKKSIDEITQQIYFEAGEEFNINSTKQLGVILFEKMGLKSGKKTKTGYSTAADVLEKLSYESDFVKRILRYRTLSKLKATYADGLLAVMDRDTHRIYSTFNQTITSTGRISSTEPNLQNIPIKLDLGRELRKVFIPENEDFIFVDADYSQIELRVLAHLSQDETLVNAFCENQDIHRLTASQVFKISFDDVTSKQRSNAKAVNFGIVYGIGAFSLSQDLDISVKEAERYIEGYFERYPKVKIYLNRLVQDAKHNGYAQTIFNRRRIIPDINSRNFQQRSFSERVAMNMPIQGTAADIIKIAMVRVYKRLKSENLKSRLILQVHDELLVEAKKDEVEQVKQILKSEMENAVQFSVPMSVDIHEGNTWFETK